MVVVWELRGSVPPGENAMKVTGSTARLTAEFSITQQALLASLAVPCLSMWFITILISLFVWRVQVYGVHANPISAHSDCQQLLRCLKLCLFQNVEDFEICEKLGKQDFFPRILLVDVKVFRLASYWAIDPRPEYQLVQYHSWLHNSWEFGAQLHCTFIFCTQTMQPKKSCKSLQLMCTLENEFLRVLTNVSFQWNAAGLLIWNE